MTTTAHGTTAPLRPPEQTDHWRPRARGRKPADRDFTRQHDADPLLVLLDAIPEGDPRRAAARSRAIEWYLPMTGYLARRFRDYGEPRDDIAQAAVIGLIKAVDRYDIRRGIPFACYAFPTILGEIRRHFRDTTWDIRVPRRIQELYRELNVATEQLTRELQHAPSTAQLGERLGISQQDVAVARLASHSYRLLSLDQPRPDRDGRGDSELTELLGVHDPALASVENRMLLRQRLARLSRRARSIISMRFDEELTQAQIAAHLGVSQMHVSRLLARSLDRLRTTA